MSEEIQVYLSIPISRRVDATEIEKYLTEKGINVFNPCRIVHDDRPKASIPTSVAQECWKWIEESDAVIFYTDYYGKDCSCEIGFAYAKSKPIFPFYLYKESSLKDEWMIRSTLEQPSEGLDSLIDTIRNSAKLNFIKVM